MYSNKRSGNNLSDKNEKVSKQRRCSLTLKRQCYFGYFEKTIADFFEEDIWTSMQKILEEVAKNKNSVQTLPYNLEFY